MKKNLKLIIPTFLLVILCVLLATNHIAFLDNVYNYIVMHNNVMTKICKIITFFGSVPGIILVSIFLLFLVKNKKELFSLYIAITCSTILNIILKWLINRPRPDLIHLVVENSSSFPSGHAMASCTFYGYLIIMLWNLDCQKKWKMIGITLLSTFILAIGYTRIYLNVHYVSDVLAGYLISFIYLILFIRLKKRKL